MSPTLETPLLDGSSVLMDEPMLGFPHDREFTLSPIDSEGVLFSLRSVREPSVRFVVTPAETFFDGYRPALPPDVEFDTERRFMLILNIAKDLLTATANLRAPLLMSSDGERIRQIVVDDEQFDMHHPLFPAQSA